MREVQAARHRLESLIDNAPAAVSIMSGPEHVYEMVNARCQRLVGADRPLLGLPVTRALPELVEQGFVALLDEVYRTGEPFLGNEVRVRFDRTGSGRLEDAFLNFIYQPRRDGLGAVAGVDCFGFDVTDQVLARERAESLSAELQLADKRKDEFLAMLAHELRNPMAALSLALTLLEDAGGDAETERPLRETARRQMGTLVRLVDDLLDVSRITRGNVELRREEVDLVSLVQHAVGSMRPALDARGHELSVTLAPGDFLVEADPTRLEQVVLNLLTNASKYTDPGGTLSVRLAREVVKGAAHAVLSVRDSGRGIPPEMLETIFDMFVQVPAGIDRSTGGLGLGLTLVRRLVEMHGGTVLAKSEGTGKGAELVVRLPLSTRGPGSAQLATNDERPAGKAEQLAATRRRILLVEDAEDVRNGLKALLTKLGHDVATAVDGLDGLAKALSVRPDVSLIDIGLPGIDGYEVARRIRSEPAGAKMFLVAITGYGGRDAKAKAEAAGFDLHLTKPVDVDELASIVRRSGK